MDNGKSLSGLSEQLGRYSDLHDAEISSLHLSHSPNVLTVTVDAEDFESEDRQLIDLEFSAVAFLEIAPSRASDPVADRSWSNYLFPIERTLDGVRLEAKEDHVRVTLLGTYGWQIIIECGAVAMRVQQPGV